MKPYYQDEWATIYHGDCREILPTLPRRDVSIISDPPYGMDWDGKVSRGKNGTGKPGKTRNWGVSIVGDDRPFDPTFLMPYGEVILWGFNHFPERLRKGTCLIWLKRYDSGFGSFLSDAEIAWFNRGCGVYCRRDVSLQAHSRFRVHPTQKPVSLMSWCIGFTSSASLILDPFSGSGTTLVAAKRLGHHSIGIEIEEKYCEIAARRVERETLTLFEGQPEPEQLTLEGQ